MNNSNLMKLLAEELVPYLMPYIEIKVKDELLNLPSREQEKPELLTKKQVMVRYQISSMTLWRMEQKGTLIPIRIGNRVMYKCSDLEKLFK